MSHESPGTSNSWTGRLQAVPRSAAAASVAVAILVGVHGIGHVTLAPETHPLVSTQSALVVLWGVTTLVALGGLAVLSGAFASLAGGVESKPRVPLAILPEDERQILEPILETPGITQVEVVARSDYSDAKVSQTLKALRERGLVYREAQGRTYRLYPRTVLAEATSAS
jgi:uncharacterized membrane protein